MVTWVARGRRAAVCIVLRPAGIYWMGVGCSDSSRGAGGQELRIVAAGAVKKAAAVGAAAAA